MATKVETIVQMTYDDNKSKCRITMDDQPRSL